MNTQLQKLTETIE